MEKSRLILILSLLFTSTAFAAFSRFVVITPENEARHPFLIQVETVAGNEQRSRVRVVGASGPGQRAWLIVCKNYVATGGQNFRDILWFDAEVKNIELLILLEPGETTLPESGDQSRAYVEAELANEQMRRAYIYIDYPRPVDDGGYFYSIDLAYYLKGSLGRERAIEWESQ